jgi:hypothetical protein
MKLKSFLLASIAITVFSCKQHDEDVTPSTPPETGKTVQAILRLSGDISVSESPLGAKMSLWIDRDLRDSTIYYVIVHKDDLSVYSGIFDHADSILLTLPTEGNVTVEAAAIKRGSGTGLYYFWQLLDVLPDYTTSGIYGNTDFEGLLKNKMDTISYPGGAGNRADALHKLKVFDPADTTNSLSARHPELDTYYGQVTFAASAAPTIINLPMKRCTFGVQYSADKFTTGRLIADFSGMMITKYLTPHDTTTQFLYTAEEFLQRDSLLNDAVTVKMEWENTDGSIVPLGEKKIYFKRNILTKIHVSIPLPGGSAPLEPVISETTWSGSETVNY